MKAVALILLAFSSFTLAQEITGAFGIKFGQPLTDLQIIDKTGDSMYFVKPPIPIKLFDVYGVEVTPISKKVWNISATKLSLSKNECHDLLKALRYKLESKYTVSFQEETGVGTTVVTEKNGKGISIMCTPEVTTEGIVYYLILVYADLSLHKQAEQETIRLKSQQIDDSGL